jgi:zinc protease
MLLLRSLPGLLIAAALGLAPATLRARPPGTIAQKAPKKHGIKHRPGKIGHGAPVAAPPPAGPEPPPRPLTAVPLAIERLTLDNGLRVVLAPERRAPRVAVAMVYDAGARNEERGATGLARLVERLMYQGSANVQKGEHERLVAARGGTTRGETSADRAAFVDEAPSSELPLLLWLEADRLKSLQIGSESAIAQRTVMLGELGQRAAEVPLAAGRTRLRELVFQAFWPYEHDPWGGAADVSALRAEAAQSFYDTFYAANNAVLVIAGDFEGEHATQLVHRFFETARKQERPPTFVAPPLPEQTSQRSAVLEAPRLRQPSFFFGWAAPPNRTDESYAIDAAIDLLASPRGRLPLRLSIEKPVASRVEAFSEHQRLADLVGLEIDLADEAQRAEAERIVEAEIDALAHSGPTDAEMARYRSHAEARSWRLLGPLDTRALTLGDFELFHGDARLAAGELARVEAVTRDKVRAAAARFLSPSRRTLVEILPPHDLAADVPPRPAPAAGPAPAPVPHGKAPKTHPKKPPAARPHPHATYP